MSTAQSSISVTLTTEATPAIAERAIARRVNALIDTGRSSYPLKWVEPLDVSEGREKCGYGPLEVNGTVEHWNGSCTVTYRLSGGKSQWKNYGAPHGARYEIAATLEQIAP